jgi:hypothetical protein
MMKITWQGINVLAMRSSVSIPPKLYEGETGIIRPRDLADQYSQPAKEARRLARLGLDDSGGGQPA